MLGQLLKESSDLLCEFRGSEAQATEAIKKLFLKNLKVTLEIDPNSEYYQDVNDDDDPDAGDWLDQYVSFAAKGGRVYLNWPWTHNREGDYFNSIEDACKALFKQYDVEMWRIEK